MDVDSLSKLARHLFVIDAVYR